MLNFRIWVWHKATIAENIGAKSRIPNHMFKVKGGKVQLMFDTKQHLSFFVYVVL
jgi:hypothetical protein